MQLFIILKSSNAKSLLVIFQISREEYLRFSQDYSDYLDTGLPSNGAYCCSLMNQRGYQAAELHTYFQFDQIASISNGVQLISAPLLQMSKAT